MKNQKTILALVVLAAVIALLLDVYFAARPETTEGEKAFTVTVIHADGTEKTFACTTGEEYLGPALLEEELVGGTEGPYGLTIDTVDGETASWEENRSYWALYVGEEYATTGADSTPVNDGDHFKLVYTLG